MKTNLFLFIYSILKAFLPLPSLEAVLLPMVLIKPEYAFLYCILTGLGTCIGGHIGYLLSNRYGRKIILKFVDESTIDEGMSEFNRIGPLFIIAGSISPFPDFILAYIAGLANMNRFLFMILDGGCRFIRSILLVYISLKFNEYLQIDKYVTYISILLLVYFIGKTALKKKRN